MRPLTCFLLAAFAAPAAGANDLRVLVTGIESDRGEIACLLYDDAKGFPYKQEAAVDTKRYAAAPGMLTCTFENVPAGRYAVAAVHDENGNQQIDGNLFGVKEPWGVSNNIRPASRAPRFGESSVSMGADRSLDLEVAIRK